MYVCVCKSVTQAEIVDMVRGGVSDFDELQFETSVGTCCGRCVDTARSLVADTLHAAARMRAGAAASAPVAASQPPQGCCACAGTAGAECDCAAAASNVTAVGPAAVATWPSPISRRLPISARGM